MLNIEGFNPTYNHFIACYEKAVARQAQLEQTIHLFNRTKARLLDSIHVERQFKKGPGYSADAADGFAPLRAKPGLLDFVLKFQLHEVQKAAWELYNSAARVKAQYNEPTASVYHCIAGQYALAINLVQSLASNWDTPRYNQDRSIHCGLDGSVFLYQQLCLGGVAKLSQTLKTLVRSFPSDLPVGTWQEDHSELSNLVRKTTELTKNLQSALAQLRSQKGILNEDTYDLRMDIVKNKARERVKLESEQRERRILVNSSRVEMDWLQRLLLESAREVTHAIAGLLQPELKDSAKSGTDYLLKNWTTRHYDVLCLASVFGAAQDATDAVQFELSQNKPLYKLLRDKAGEVYARTHKNSLHDPTTDSER